jgi:hypothetical protein
MALVPDVGPRRAAGTQEDEAVWGTGGRWATLRVMTRKRPCRICRRWFQPHPRAGNRQRVCDRAECQRERHRRACAQWRRNNAAEEKEQRLRDKLRQPVPTGARAVTAGLRLETVRDAVGPQMAVIIEETGEVLGDWVRDAVRGKQLGMIGESAGLPPAGARDGIASGRGPL